ncbi:MAG TPA: hypothetical protein VGR57_12615 [Ktedonobacterales bacterium]|nr:hypothetical protein [Ktedonobacterales bacterium]
MSAPSGDAPPLPQRIIAGVREVAGRLRPPAVERSTTAAPPSAQRATPTTGASGANATPQPKFGRGMSRLAIGMLAYVVGSYALQIVLALINGNFGLGLDQVQTLFPKTTPLIGTMSKFALIYFILVIVLIWALFRFNIIPRDPFGARAQAQARARGNAPAAPPTETVSWSARKRAARKAADAAATDEPDVAGDYDEEYERVRAMLRGRRRK